MSGDDGMRCGMRRPSLPWPRRVAVTGAAVGREGTNPGSIDPDVDRGDRSRGASKAGWLVAPLFLAASIGCLVPADARADGGARLLDDAEQAYRQRRDREAFAAFGQVVAAAPQDPRAWLRIGNLWQRNGDPARAAEAYRRALDTPVTEDPVGRQARAKATLNLALLGLEQARQSLATLESGQLPAELRTLAETLTRQVRIADATAEAGRAVP